MYVSFNKSKGVFVILWKSIINRVLKSILSSFMIKEPWRCEYLLYFKKKRENY